MSDCQGVLLFRISDMFTMTCQHRRFCTTLLTSVGSTSPGEALYFLPLCGNLLCKTNATVIVDKHHAAGIIFSRRDSFMRPGTAPDKLRAVVNLLQVFNLLGWQKSTDFVQGPFPLDRVLEMSLRSGIPSRDYEKDFS